MINDGVYKYAWNYGIIKLMAFRKKANKEEWCYNLSMINYKENALKTIIIIEQVSDTTHTLVDQR